MSQPRERPVSCWCHRTTWNVSGLCDRHEPNCSVCLGTGFYVNSRGVQSSVRCNMHGTDTAAEAFAAEGITVTELAS